MIERRRKMKKATTLFLLMLLCSVSIPVSAVEQTNNEVGITFYQPTNKNQTIPMERVTIENPKKNERQSSRISADVGSKIYPKTNEAKPFLFAGVGMLVLLLMVFLSFLKNKHRHGEMPDGKL